MRPIRLLILLLAIALTLVLALVRPLQGRANRAAKRHGADAAGVVRRPEPRRRLTQLGRGADVRLPRRLVCAPLHRDPVQLWRLEPGHRVRLLGARPLRLRALRHQVAALELGRPLARPTDLAPVAPARRPRLLLRRGPRRDLRRPRSLHRRAAQRSARSRLDDGCVLGLLRRPALPGELEPQRIFSAMAVSSFQAIVELVSTSGRKSHGVMP